MRQRLLRPRQDYSELPGGTLQQRVERLGALPEAFDIVLQNRIPPQRDDGDKYDSYIRQPEPKSIRTILGYMPSFRDTARLGSRVLESIQNLPSEMENPVRDTSVANPYVNYYEQLTTGGLMNAFSDLAEEAYEARRAALVVHVMPQMIKLHDPQRDTGTHDGPQPE